MLSVILPVTPYVGAVAEVGLVGHLIADSAFRAWASYSTQIDEWT